jgi:Ca2+-binding RTX toxin-like protein
MLLAAVGTTGCVVEVDDDDVEAADSALLGDDPGLCNRLIARRKELGAVATVQGASYQVIHGSAGNDEIVGTPGPDLIFGGRGDDRIHGGAGGDIICAGGGNDFVDGNLGQDRIYGGDGDDILHGGGAGDWIHGEGGDDQIFGGILDDKLYGDEGNDLLVGGHGVDHMEGGPGNDWLRGDTNGDDFIGGPGEDVVSFMTARPTGKAQKGALYVMNVDLPKQLAGGDGANELLKGIEKVIGSAFADNYVGPADRFVGGFGNDSCNGSPCGFGAPAALPFVYVDARPRDTGVVVLGSESNDQLTFERINGQVVVTEMLGGPLHAGAHCSQTAVNVVTCVPGAPLRYLVAWGGGGNDELTMTSGFPRDFTAHLDGGEGDDRLVGADGDDVLFSGRSGADFLDGGPGDDALISESYADERQKSGSQYGGGADTLVGRGGNDQLVCDYPCGGHYYSGGPGFDIAGFARVGERSIHAQLAGPIRNADKSPFFGRAFLPNVCNVDQYGTRLEADLEVLEGSTGNDKLLGNNADNVIWGRQGNDILRGFDGNDVLLGHEGNDQLFGGDGDDVERQ